MYIMSISVKGYHRKPTYDELIQEAVINPTETIKYPNRIATQLRNTPQLTRFDDESFLDMNTINSNAMKQTMQRTAVQRAMQPVARPIPTGVQQFDMAAGEETQVLGEELDEKGKSYQRYEDKMAKKKARLAAISEEELTAPGQIDDMLAKSSAAAAASGYGTGSASSSSSAAAADTDVGASTAIVPVSARTQALEEVIQVTQGNLRGGVVPASPIHWGPKVPPPKKGGGFYHKRSASGASTESATSGVSATSTATTVAIPTVPTVPTVAIPQQISSSKDLQILLDVARDRRREWNKSNDVAKVRISMNISDLIYQLEQLIKLEGKFRTDPETGHRVKTPIWSVAKKKTDEYTLELIKIMQMPE